MTGADGDPYMAKARQFASRFRLDQFT